MSKLRDALETIMAKPKSRALDALEQVMGRSYDRGFAHGMLAGACVMMAVVILMAFIFRAAVMP